jgi:hypothetical protein
MALRRRPSRRSAGVCWTVTVLAFVVCAVWVASFWVAARRSWGAGVSILLDAGEIGVSQGTLYWLTWNSGSALGGFQKGSIVDYEVAVGYSWGPSVSSWWPPHGGRWVAANHGAGWVPLWPPTAILALLAAWLWRRHFVRRRLLRSGHCACGYDRAGLADDAPCPECGRTASCTRAVAP